ncbi:MAG: YdcF family protein [Gammaproteobacteria bacterium]|nr:YdcF family protein [Gammaproteobacteria bacterium]
MRNGATSEKPAVIVFGSKVLENGVPSGSLVRRTLGALAWAKDRRLQPTFVVSGGRGANPPEEARVMRDLLIRFGAVRDDIVMDTDSTDTLQNVINTSRIVRRLGATPVWICSDDYHVPRCWLLMHILGASCRPIFLSGSRLAVGRRRWARYCAHEFAAILRDAFLAIAKRRSG